MNEKYLPLFPLQLVAFPYEQLNLHIFESRYKKLINECLETGQTFGIPTYIKDNLPGFGCEVQVIELVRRYEDGRMDVATKGLQVFQLISFDNPAPQKLYSGGQVVLMPEAEAYPWVSVDLLEKTELLYRYLDTPTLYDPELPQPYSFQVAHKIGLTLEQEYNLLQMSTEAERQSFLEIHLEKVLPVMEQMQRTRERIRLNGHFKNLDPLEF
jgi:hypothetical protein